MTTIEPIIASLGFGAGGTPGEYYYSQGMIRSQNGLVPGWKVTALIDDGTLTTLTIINWFGQQTVGTDFYVFGIDTNGKIYRSQNGTGTWSLYYTPLRTSYG